VGDLLIRDIPEDLKRELIAAARSAGRSLSDEAKAALKKGVAVVQGERDAIRSDAYGDFRREFADALLTDEDHEDMMSAIDAWKQESLSAKAQAAE
jgi:plasmid stability protein